MHFWVPRVEKRKKKLGINTDMKLVSCCTPLNFQYMYYILEGWKLLFITYTPCCKAKNKLNYAVCSAHCLSILHFEWIKLWFCFAWKLNPVNVFQFSREQNCNVSSHWNRLFFTVMWLLFFNRRPAWILVSRRSFMQKNLGFFATPTLQKHL